MPSSLFRADSLRQHRAQCGASPSAVTAARGQRITAHVWQAAEDKRLTTGIAAAETATGPLTSGNESAWNSCAALCGGAVAKQHTSLGSCAIGGPLGCPVSKDIIAHHAVNVIGPCVVRAVCNVLSLGRACRARLD